MFQFEFNFMTVLLFALVVCLLIILVTNRRVSKNASEAFEHLKETATEEIGADGRFILNDEACSMFANITMRHPSDPYFSVWIEGLPEAIIEVSVHRKMDDIVVYISGRGKKERQGKDKVETAESDVRYAIRRAKERMG